MRFIRIVQISDDKQSKYVGNVKDEDIVKEFFKLKKDKIQQYVVDNLLPVATIEDYEVKTPLEPLFGFTTEVYEAGVDKYDTLYYSFHTWQDPEALEAISEEDDQPSKTRTRKNK